MDTAEKKTKKFFTKSKEQINGIYICTSLLRPRSGQTNLIWTAHCSRYILDSPPRNAVCCPSVLGSRLNLWRFPYELLMSSSRWLFLFIYRWHQVGNCCLINGLVLGYFVGGIWLILHLENNILFERLGWQRERIKRIINK